MLRRFSRSQTVWSDEELLWAQSKQRKSQARQRDFEAYWAANFRIVIFHVVRRTIGHETHVQDASICAVKFSLFIQTRDNSNWAKLLQPKYFSQIIGV